MESSVDVLDEFCDLDRTGVVALCYAVASKTCLSRTLEPIRMYSSTARTYQLVDQRNQRLKILLDGQMEDIPVLDVDGNCERLGLVAERDTLISLPFMT